MHLPATNLARCVPVKWPCGLLKYRPSAADRGMDVTTCLTNADMACDASRNPGGGHPTKSKNGLPWWPHCCPPHPTALARSWRCRDVHMAVWCTSATPAWAVHPDILHPCHPCATCVKLMRNTCWIGGLPSCWRGLNGRQHKKHSSPCSPQL